MIRMQKNTLFLVVAGIGLFLAGCAGTPDTNPLLQEAQTAYQEAENDTEVVKNAPVALDEAEEALVKAQRALEQGEETEVVNHEAYIAQQRIKIAKQTALLYAAQDEVKRAESQRQEVLIQARQAEAAASEQRAEASEKRAEEALSEAEQERMEAEQAREAAEAARQKAQKLAERVDELEAQQTERGLVLTLGDVLFDVDEATLKPGGQRAVTELKNFLSEYKERNVLIEGHTDNTGSDSYNQKLSQQRANAVRQALIGQGVAGTRIRSAGLGEQYPKASNNTNAGRQQNRRVEVIISDKSGEIPDRQ